MVAPRLWATLEQIGFLPREQLTWIKALNPEDVVTSTAWGSWCSASNPVLRAVAEPVFIASKLTHRRSPGISDLTSDEFKAWTRNVWNIPAGNGERDLDHLCKFSAELPRRLIKLYSYVGDVVLDSFCGSGTTLRVAKDLARRAVGVDIPSVLRDERRPVPTTTAVSSRVCRCRSDGPGPSVKSELFRHERASRQVVEWRIHIDS